MVAVGNVPLDITLDLRNLGIPWTLHCWMHTLATAHDQQLENIIDQLLQDFLQVWPDDYSTQFVDECLPLLFNIFRFSKVLCGSCQGQKFLLNVRAHRFFILLVAMAPLRRLKLWHPCSHTLLLLLLFLFLHNFLTLFAI